MVAQEIQQGMCYLLKTAQKIPLPPKFINTEVLWEIETIALSAWKKGVLPAISSSVPTTNLIPIIHSFVTGTLWNHQPASSVNGSQ
jgi:hypothetical protein